ncbi:nicotinate phosphoribosyltransferase [Oceanihabitans sediminis]|uniref:Nicotinate phosphoribosyltransferase n=1 Tax=Oceanihabitans sediminis TaxID=1812012 RepID=A0A368P5M7_9FLAO|nr:nicotinate phosphoribosyltransferase [Oceanihabitans sediminis]MDX1277243.1 nicotinate phosphoribosyltransferase [Oceanihabitans sediminis]MDX1773662.1 nicotinate phosphoribosyltransferase [Oceanihabitans sediminis]RBP33106.1 nicotinate phosphoribosyltransferase [Oceanihabitans sediminis]RCU57384.1 nicotinate phosphoribosyltransferase [Oceanihabitans sediminis]
MQITAAYTDLYQLTMAQVYFNTKPDGKAVFDYYYRSNPFKGGYAIFTGLEDVLNILENFKFSASDLKYLEQHGFEQAFLDYLKDFKFNGTINSSKEGDVVFPNRPILQVEANIIEAQIIETVLLNILNFQTLIATKASRIRYSAQNETLLDMGLRRAHATGGYYASRAAAIGGFDATSNVIAAEDYGIPSSGTMAHSFIQSYEDELKAFQDFAQHRPKNCVLLIDTYNTLKSGLPKAIQVAKEMESRGEQLMGVRLDSGDLAYLAKKTRKMLDEANLQYVKIVVSNQLDEYVIKSLKEQGAPIDIYGVGTNLVTGKPDASFGGVYKLSEYNGAPRIKLSENLIKVSLPYKKQVYRMIDENGKFYGADAVGLFKEGTLDEMVHPFDINKSLNLERFTHEPLLEKVMENGKRITPSRTVTEIAAYSKSRLEQLPLEYKRFQNPHIYKVGLSNTLKQERDELLKKHKY